MHDAGNALKSRFFFLTDVSVTFEDDDVALSVYDPMDQDIASDVTYQGYCASAYVAVCPWTQGDLVAKMYEEWIHAVAFDSKGHGAAFSNEFADFFVHRVFVYAYLL